MTKKYIFLLAAFFVSYIGAEETHTENLSAHTVLDTKIKPTQAQKNSKKMVWFRYKDEPVINMVNDLAKKRGINIMLPQGANALTAKLTFDLPNKISLSKAWQYMITILELSGYTIVPHKEYSMIVKNDANVNNEALPLYVGVSPQELPNTDLKIRYLRYLTFLQVPGGSGSGSTSLQSLFAQMLSPNYSVIYQPQQNAVLITDTARNIKSAMTIVDELDASSPVEEPEYIRLIHTTAGNVKALLSTLIPGAQQSSNQGYGAPPAQASSSGGYFAKGTKIVAEDRLNTLILLGKKDALARIKDFIKTYIDVPPENGQSILHVYTLKYLKAENFAPILTQIVQSQSGGSSGGYSGYGSGTGQSSSSGGGNEFRQFQGVQITAEGSGSGDNNYGGGGYGNSVQTGSQTGNRLIIAALKDDWIRIEKLIKELDKPQVQVIVHGLIVDLSSTALKDFANQVRNHSGLFLRDVNWQTGHIAGIENGLTDSSTAPTDANALQANLLPVTSTGFSSGNIASNASAGSFIMSFKDNSTNGIWWISTILGSHTDSKVLSQPFLMTMNNKQVTFVDSEERRLPGASSQQFGVEVTNQEDVNASITLTILPRINANGRINLSLTANVNQFTGTNNAQLTRNVTTNVNLYDKDILILGGLTKTKVENTIYKTPLLGDIPILGSMFKKRKKIVTKTNLMIFLRPEIVKLSDNHIADRYFKKAGQLLAGGEENFSLLRDPVTRWFFGKDPEGATPEALGKFKEELDPLEFKEQYKSAPLVPMPNHKDEEINHNKPIAKLEKRIKPSEQKPLDPDIEEQAAEEELKKLFMWDNENKTAISSPVHEDKKESNTLSTAQISAQEEAKAEKELEALFKDSEALEELAKARLKIKQ